MNLTIFCKRIGLVSLPAVLGLFAGCSEGHARYKPTSSEAASSLEKALSAWRDGKAYGALQTTPPVHVVDSLWQSGQQLESFQIGGEEDPGDGTKQFAVKMKLKKSAGDQEARYVVHGRDPVWVFRDEDYKRTLNMDNNPEPPKPKSGSPRAGRIRR
jgi:hypothetical protein